MSGARGQALVLMALCLTLVVVMALLTLGIGQRVRERIQLQTLTDAAAYSDATLVARTYNEIALANRGIIGDMVAMAATYSLVDYASAWASDVTLAKRALAEARGRYQLIAADCVELGLSPAAPRCACARAAAADGAWDRAEAALDGELARLNALPLQGLDANAAGEANDYRAHALAMHEHAAKMLNDELSFQVSPYQVAKTYARAAGAAPGELKVPLANDAISLREARQGLVDESSGPEHRRFVDVGRGTRYAFVYDRRHAAPLDARFAALLAAAGVTGLTFTVTRSGSADWVAANTLLRAHDDSTVTASYRAAGPACGPSRAAQRARSQLTTAAGAHVWPVGHDSDPKRHELVACEAAPSCAPSPPQLYDWSSLGRGANPPRPQCPLPSCQRSEDLGALPRLATAAAMTAAMAEGAQCAPCPGVWPAYLGLHSRCAEDAADLFCQPKQYAVLQRDYAARTSRAPWSLELSLSQGGALKLGHHQLADGTDISRQTAVAGGLAYYHYGGGGRWAEAPNLLNPFWRSTLAPMDVDAEGDPRAVPSPGRDIPNLLLQMVNPASASSRASGVLAREAFLELTRHGYRGIP